MHLQFPGGEEFDAMDQPQAEGDDLHYKDLLHLTCE